jgi:elongation factor 1-beta
MGDVSLTMRVLPDDPSVDLTKLAEAVRQGLPAQAKLAKTSVAPFAFGLKALMCNIVVPDEAGLADEVEAALRKIPKIQGVELVDMGRLM